MSGKTKAVLAGYGNIGRAFESIMKQGVNDNIDLTICEIKNGCDCLDYIADHAGDIDMVINLSTQPTVDVLGLCLEKKLDYIDAGTEGDPYDVPFFDYYNKMLDIRGDSRMLFGFGVNPGMLEHVYFRNRPQGKHLAFEFEYDEARSDKAPVFNTWSPAAFYDEAVVCDKLLAGSQRGFIDVTDYCNDHGVMKLTAGGRKREFIIVPHEELFSFRRLDPNCLGAAYLYQASITMHEFCRDRGKDASEEEVMQIPTLHDIDGEDHIGMLFYDFSDNLYYVKNATSHSEIYRKFKVNATCWETACGIHTGLRMLRNVPKGKPVTMSDLSMRYPHEIDAIFKELGFNFERVDFAVDRKEFEQEILPLFSTALS